MRALILSVLAFACVATAKAPSVILDARASAVQIIYSATDKKTGEKNHRAICSGAVVKLTGGVKVVSAGHCVSHDPKGEYFALDHQGKIWPLQLGEWKFEWPRDDRAVFTSLATLALPPLKVAARASDIGDDVYSWSGPLGLSLMLYKGQVTGELHFPTDPEGEKILGGMLNTTLDTDGGASGSVVMNEKGEAIGILVGGWKPTTKLHGSYLAPLPK